MAGDTDQTDTTRASRSWEAREILDSIFFSGSSLEGRKAEATSKGVMLTAGAAVQGSAGYVAIEQVSGTLHGRRGTFVLQHSGTMTRGAPQLTITVVPDSGTAQLASLSGRMTIAIADGKHSYDFKYTLAETP